MGRQEARARPHRGDLDADEALPGAGEGVVARSRAAAAAPPQGASCGAQQQPGDVQLLPARSWCCRCCRAGRGWGRCPGVPSGSRLAAAPAAARLAA
jgi:hypothetical protein